MQKSKFRTGFATIKILGIETSCDETAAAVVAGNGKNSPHILSNIVASQVKIHAQTGGIVPEVAARAHAEKIMSVIEQSLRIANPKSEILNSKQILNSKFKILNSIDAIAVTIGPGLIGSLLIGVETAKTLAHVFNKLIIPINHLEGHIYSNFIRVNLKSQISNLKISFPALCLIVSGGHTSLTLMKDHGKYQEIGSTRDDAAGEAFDKVAKLLGLSYPGGPSIAKAAASINSKFEAPARLASENIAGRRNPKQYLNSKFKILKLPRPMIDSGDFDFSFSGLKTAVLYLVRSIQDSYPSSERSESRSSSSRLRSNNKETMPLRNAIASEFQQAVVDVLVAKTLKAAKKYSAKTVILGGGVSANQLLRDELKLKIVNCKLKIDFLAPPKNLSTDNAAMIAAAGYYHYIRKDYADWRKIKVNPNRSLNTKR